MRTPRRAKVVLLIAVTLLGCTPREALLMAETGGTPTARTLPAATPPAVSGAVVAAESAGRFMAHDWRISPGNNVVYWDGHPYVPYGLWLGGVETGIQSGLKEFSPIIESAGEDLRYKLRNGQVTLAEAMKADRDTISAIVRAGGTYVISIGPTTVDYQAGRPDIRGLRDDDRFAYVNRVVLDVSERSGQTGDLEATLHPFLPGELVKAYGGEAYLFDYDRNTCTNISAAIRSVSWERAPGGGEGEGKGESRPLGMRLGDVHFPRSSRLAVTALWKVRYAAISGSEAAMCGGAGGFIPMWKPKILENTRKAWTALRPVLQTEQLRAINLFGGEVLLSRIFLVRPAGMGGSGEPMESGRGLYPNYGDDAYTLTEYRDWLKARFQTVEALNRYAGTDWNSFGEARWLLPVRPDNAAESVDHGRLFGLFRTAGFEQRLDGLQNEFHQELFGKWYGEYSRLAKEVFGDVPTFTYAGGRLMIGDTGYSPANCLDVHLSALRHGVDGIGMSMYESVSELTGGEANSLWRNEKLISRFQEVQRATGRTKFMWVYEGTCVVKDSRAYGGWLGPAQPGDLDEWLQVMVGRGARGFFVGGVFPEIGCSKPWQAVGDVTWYKDLQPAVVQKAIAARTISDVPQATPSRKSASARPAESREQRDDSAAAAHDAPSVGAHDEPSPAVGAAAIEGAARGHERMRQLLARYPRARAVTKFDDKAGTWIVRFYDGQAEIAVVTLNGGKQILEVEAFRD